MLENVWDTFWLLIYIYCWPFKPILGVLGFGGDPLAPPWKNFFFLVNFLIKAKTRPGPGMFIEALTLTWSRYLLKSTLVSGIVRQFGVMTSMTQNRALSLVHPSVDTSTNYNVGFKSRVEEGHHYLDFRLILRSCTSEYFYKVKIMSS